MLEQYFTRTVSSTLERNVHRESTTRNNSTKRPFPTKKKKQEKKRKCFRRAHSAAGHDIPSFFLLTGSSSSFIHLVPVIKMLRKRSPENANINVKKNWMYLKLTSYLNNAFSGYIYQKHVSCKYTCIAISFWGVYVRVLKPKIPWHSARMSQ